jgi:hypothetical protein
MYKVRNDNTENGNEAIMALFATALIILLTLAIFL